MRITQPAPFIWAAPPFARRNVWQMVPPGIHAGFSAGNGVFAYHRRYPLHPVCQWCPPGSGPMKYFQAHIPYDTYDIAPCLRCGKNVIGVLVHYWGVGTMQHQFGEPGLWLQAIVQGGERRLEIGTGPEFLTASCAALDSRSPRICRAAGFYRAPGHVPLGGFLRPRATAPIPSAGRPPSPPPGTRPCCLPGISRL